MSWVRLALAVVAAFLLLVIGGCVVFGIGSSDGGSVGDLLTTPTQIGP